VLSWVDSCARRLRGSTEAGAERRWLIIESLRAYAGALRGGLRSVTLIPEAVSTPEATLTW